MNWVTAARRMRENGGKLPVRKSPKRKQILLSPQEREWTTVVLNSLERRPYHPEGGEFDKPGREAILFGKEPTGQESDLAKRVEKLEAQVARLTRQLQRTSAKSAGNRMEWPAEYAELRIGSQSPLGKQ